jgi:hypothetical protein
MITTLTSSRTSWKRLSIDSNHHPGCAKSIEEVQREFRELLCFGEGLIPTFPAVALAAIESKTPAEFSRQGPARWMTNGEH